MSPGSTSSPRRRAAAVLAIAGLLSLLLIVRVPGQGVWHGVMLNAVHGPIFALVAVLLLVLRAPAARSRLSAYWTAFFAAVVFGGIIEFLQGFQDRPPSWFDMMTDAAGASAGLALWALFERWRAPAFQLKQLNGPWLPVAIALAGVTFVAWPPLQAARAYAHRAAVFPSIAEFHGPQDLAFVTTSGTAADIAPLPGPWGQGPDDLALRVSYDEKHAPSVQVVEPSHDWRGYTIIAVDITNPSPQELSLTFRILDAAHDWSHEDRLNLPLRIPPSTRTTVRVALGAVEAAPERRPMDMTRIANVMLFGRESPQPAEMYVSRIWLE